jgi:hypothetical protein
MVAGIVLFAFALRTALRDTEHHLETVAVIALTGGPILYLLAHVGLRLRLHGSLARGRLVTAGLLAASALLLGRIPAVAALAIVVAGCAALITYEVVRFREPRALVRSRRTALRLTDVDATRSQITASRPLRSRHPNIAAAARNGRARRAAPPRQIVQKDPFREDG